MKAPPPPSVATIEPRKVLPTAARKPKGYAHQLIKTRCATWDLGQHPDLQQPADLSHIHLQEQIAEGGIRGRPPELKPQRLVQRIVMAVA